MTREAFDKPETQAREPFLAAGTAYGVIFGLSFALVTWGYDALALASSEAALAWAKLVLGLPLVVAICSLAGYLAALSQLTAVFAALWAVTGALLGIITGHMPFDGSNLTAWLAERRLWGLIVFPYGDSAAVRTTLMVIIGAGVGAAAGLLERLAIEWAWDRATPQNRMSLRSWAVLLVCIPLILLFAGAANELVNRPVRRPQQVVSDLIRLAIAGARDRAEARGLNYAVVEDFRGSFSDQFTTHLVEYNLAPPQVACVDAVFDNSFALRCRTLGKHVAFCSEVSSRFEDWMNDLIYAGLYGERRWMASPNPSLDVDDRVVRWLQGHAEQLSETYDVFRLGQHAPFVFMSARFDTGFQMTCRFRGTSPVLVDQCIETRSGHRR